MAKKSIREIRQDLLLNGYTAVSEVSVNSDHLESKGVFDFEEISIAYPVDPQTGLPSSDASRLLDDKISKFEKERIYQRLQSEKGTYMPSELSDSEILDLMPPRFLTRDQVDIQWFRDFLSDKVLPHLSDKANEVLDSMAPDIKEQTEQTEQTEQ